MLIARKQSAAPLQDPSSRELFGDAQQVPCSWQRGSGGPASGRIELSCSVVREVQESTRKLQMQVTGTTKLLTTRCAKLSLIPSCPRTQRTGTRKLSVLETRLNSAAVNKIASKRMSCALRHGAPRKLVHNAGVAGLSSRAHQSPYHSDPHTLFDEGVRKDGKS